jgi:hypothetical protein
MKKHLDKETVDWIKTNGAKCYVVETTPCDEKCRAHKHRVVIADPRDKNYVMVGCADSYEQCVEQLKESVKIINEMS